MKKIRNPNVEARNKFEFSKAQKYPPNEGNFDHLNFDIRILNSPPLFPPDYDEHIFQLRQIHRRGELCLAVERADLETAHRSDNKPRWKNSADARGVNSLSLL